MNHHDDPGLSDVLRDMAGGDGSGGRPAQPQSPDDCEFVHAELADPHPLHTPTSEPRRVNSPAPARSSRRPATPKRAQASDMRSAKPSSARTKSSPPRRRPARKSGLKATAVPLLGTVGLLLLIPAVWAVMVLMNAESSGDDRGMAVAMLVAWPIALCLLAAAVVLFIQVAKEQKQAKLRG